MGISFLTILVFYLPSDSGEKVSPYQKIKLNLLILCKRQFRQQIFLFEEHEVFSHLAMKKIFSKYDEMEEKYQKS